MFLINKIITQTIAGDDVSLMYPTKQSNLRTIRYHVLFEIIKIEQIRMRIKTTLVLITQLMIHNHIPFPHVIFSIYSRCCLLLHRESLTDSPYKLQYWTTFMKNHTTFFKFIDTYIIYHGYQRFYWYSSKRQWICSLNMQSINNLAEQNRRKVCGMN